MYRQGMTMGERFESRSLMATRHRTFFLFVFVYFVLRFCVHVCR